MTGLKRASSYLRLAVVISLLTICALILRQQFKTISVHDILVSLSVLPMSTLFAALGLTLLSFFTLSCYDTLALFFLKRPLPYWKIAITSFSSYAVSNTVGFALLTATPIRYYFYSSWGLTLREILKLMAFCILTGWCGLLLLSGSVLIIEQTMLDCFRILPAGSELTIGLVLVAIVAGYLGITFIHPKPFVFLKWSYHLPHPKMAMMQIIVSTVDWLLVSAVLFVLLPQSDKLPYPVVIGIFMLAQSAGSLSQIPGGLGVFETTILLFITTVAGKELTPQVVSALLVYRGVYYLLPFSVAALFLGIFGFRFFVKEKAINEIPHEPS